MHAHIKVLSHTYRVPLEWFGLVAVRMQLDSYSAERMKWTQAHVKHFGLRVTFFSWCAPRNWNHEARTEPNDKSCSTAEMRCSAYLDHTGIFLYNYWLILLIEISVSSAFVIQLSAFFPPSSLYFWEVNEIILQLFPTTDALFLGFLKLWNQITNQPTNSIISGWFRLICVLMLLLSLKHTHLNIMEPLGMSWYVESGVLEQGKHYSVARRETKWEEVGKKTQKVLMVCLLYA